MKAIFILLFIPLLMYGQISMGDEKEDKPKVITQPPVINPEKLDGDYKTRTTERHHILSTEDVHVKYICIQLCISVHKAKTMEGKLQHTEILWDLINRIRLTTVGPVLDYDNTLNEEEDMDARRSFFNFWKADNKQIE